jgi:hypothetical protein
MAKQKLTPTQKEEIRKKRQEGESVAECISYMKETYGIDVPAWKISYVCGWGKDRGEQKKSPIRQGKAPRKYRTRRLSIEKPDKKQKELAIFEEGIEPSVSLEQALKDIKTARQMEHNGYRAIFLHMRLDAIRKAGRVFKIAKENGIEIKSEDVAEGSEE